MVKFFKFTILLFSLLFLSCEDFFKRYDPIEAARDLYDLDSFSFPYWLTGSTSNNDTYLDLDAVGEIDHDNRTVNLIIPPSLDIDSTELSAYMDIKNIGIDGGYGGYAYIYDRNWGINNSLKITKELAGVTDDSSEVYYELEYKLNFTKKLIFNAYMYPDKTISTYPYNIFYLTATPYIFIYFNDLVQISTLAATDFDTNYTISTINYSGDPSSYFEIVPNTLSEGIYYIKLGEDICESSTAGYFNKSSLSYTFAYDSNPPITDSSFTTTGSNFSPAADSDFILSISFSSATDTITPSNDILYKICFSTTAATDVDGSTAAIITNMYSTTNYIPVNGYEWFSYQDTITFSYNDLPTAFQSNLINSVYFYINILAMDGSYSTDHCASYNVITNQYLGP